MGAIRRAPAILALVAVLLGCLAWPASARHNFSMLEVASQEVAAGDEVAVSGFSYTDTAFIRLGQVDGPVLAALEPTDDDIISGTVRIPETTSAGRYVLYAVQQDEAGNPSRFPGQAALTVVEPGGPPLNLATGLAPAPEVRPTDFVVADPFSIGNFLAIMLATVGVASILTVLAYGAASSRRGALAGQRS